RQTGFAMLASGSVQEVMDLGGIAHLAAIKSSVPFLHFFDGFRTSHELQKIEVMEYEDFAKLVDHEAVERFRNSSLNSEHPVTKGTAQNPDIYFQGAEASNIYYDRVPDIVNDYMKEINKITGRDYKPFNYVGHPEAERIIIAMGSVTDTIEETVEYLVKRGEKVGAIKVRLYRPFSAKYFFDVMPKTVKKIAVLDRTKEKGSVGEPLYLDVKNIFFDRKEEVVIVGGRYGLASKDTTPSQILAVYENLKQEEPKDRFTIGIIDDVTHTSLEIKEEITTEPGDRVRCKFWGFGSDGTVGANKQAIKIIGDNTDMYAQAYFSYDSKKSGGVTISHLRFGKSPIKSTYLISEADFISCSKQSYLHQYDVLKGLKKGGTFLLNTIWEGEELERNLPAKVKKYIYENEINFYTINATKIASEIGLGGRTNMIMQAAFFKLANIIPVEEAVGYLKKSIKEEYGAKGDD
ncbi:2-oxoacid:acceptor oxidoreductase family protein, partial [Lutispora thermophila]